MKLEDYMMPCLNKSIFGVDCFGCGTQRSLSLLLKGEFIEAFYMFPAIYTTILFFIFSALHLLIKKAKFHNTLIALAILNSIIMIISYIYKLTHF